jgi:dipeptidyl aminopeptidase/acylaminoacyl peptidase
VKSRRGVLLLVLAAAAVLAPGATGRPAQLPGSAGSLVRVRTIRYRTAGGEVGHAYVVLPAWYRRKHDPALPLVISPHGRGDSAFENALIWGDLPDLGPFMVVSPDDGSDLEDLYGWGAPRQISDLARMPAVIRAALPWVRIQRRRIYAVGGSMGGQEVLLLVAHHPRLLAGAVSFDAPTSMALRYRDFSRLKLGKGLQELMRTEVGGTPRTDPGGYAARSPLHFARRIAFSNVPLQIWWSKRDRIVRDGNRESGLLYRMIKRLNPDAPVVEFVGTWQHQAEMRPSGQLPKALRLLRLLHVRIRHGEPVGRMPVVA